MMGDDGEKFGAWPTTWEHCWGERRWVDRFFEALEANADWLTTTTPVGVARRPRRRSAASTSRPARTPRWASGRCRPTRAGPSRRVLHAARGRAAPRGALAARRVLAQLPGPLPRDQRPAQADAPDLGRGRRRCPTVTTGRAPSTTSTGPVERLLLARPVRRDLHQPHAAGHLRAPDRRRGPRRHRRRPRCTPPNGATSTSTATTRSAWRVPARSSRSTWPKGAGIGGWDIRAVRHASCAVMRRRPEAYHQTLRDHDEAGGEPGTRRGRDGRPDLDPRDRPDQGAGPRGQLYYDPYERRSGLVRFLAPGTTPEAWATADAVELGDAVEGAYEIETLELDRLVARRDASVSIGRGRRARGGAGGQGRSRSAATGGRRR